LVYALVSNFFCQARFLVMKLSVLFIVLLSVLDSYSQNGKSFPSIETEKLSGEKVRIPEAFDESFTLVGVGTGKRAEEELRTWQTPVYNKFIAKTGLMDSMYDVDVVFLPLFTGAARMAKNKVVKKLKKNNEKVVRDYLYIYSGDREPFNKIGIDDRKKPYFLLLDAKGNIIWQAKGRFEQNYFGEIEAFLNQ
jgi:hypothetical protein